MIVVRQCHATWPVLLCAPVCQNYNVHFSAVNTVSHQPKCTPMSKRGQNVFLRWRDEKKKRKRKTSPRRQSRMQMPQLSEMKDTDMRAICLWEVRPWRLSVSHYVLETSKSTHLMWRIHIHLSKTINLQIKKYQEWLDKSILLLFKKNVRTWRKFKKTVGSLKQIKNDMPLEMLPSNI